MADDGVPDVQLLDLRDGGDGAHVLVGEPVSRVDREPERGAERRGTPQAAQVLLPLLAARVRVLARVQLDGVRAELRGGADGVRVRVDEEGGVDADVAESLQRAGRRGAGSR